VLLTGQLPFSGSTVEKLMAHQQSEPTPAESLRADLPPRLVRVLRKMMAKRAQDRYQTPAEVAEALAPFCRIEDDQPAPPRAQEAPPPAPTPRLEEDTASDLPAPPLPRHKRGRRLLATAVLGLLVLVVAGVAVAAVLWRRQNARYELIVAQEGNGQYTSINDALKAVGRQKTVIKVGSGTYRESLLIDGDIDVEIVGENNWVVVEATDQACLLVKSGRVKVSNLTLRSKTTGKGAAFPAVEVGSGQAALENCPITSDSHACVVIHDTPAPCLLRKCEIRGGKQAGVAIHKGGQALLEDCDISGNAGPGLEIRDAGSLAQLKKCAIRNNGGYGVLLAQAGAGQLQECTLAGNAAGSVQLADKGTQVDVASCTLGGKSTTIGITVD
jgi:hypothetical protein